MTQTFEAPTIQEALSLVRAQLGSRARILDTSRLRSPGIMGFGRRALVRVTASSPETSPPSESAESSDLRGRVEALKSHWSVREPAGKAPLRAFAKLERAARAAGWREETVQAMVADLEGTKIFAGSSRRTLRRLLEIWLSSQMKSANLRLGETCRAIMVVGPTGAGKTTTLAKLAARHLRDNAGSIALLSLDTERVGGTDLLSAFADILDVPFARVHSNRDIPATLRKLGWVRHLLIDTPGLTPFQAEPAARIRDCLANLPLDETLLVLPLSTRGRDAERLHTTYRSLETTALAVTKLDEIDNIPALLDICRATELPLAYIASGPRASTDIEPADVEEMARWIAEDFLKKPQAKDPT